MVGGLGAFGLQVNCVFGFPGMCYTHRCCACAKCYILCLGLPLGQPILIRSAIHINLNFKLNSLIMTKMSYPQWVNTQSNSSRSLIGLSKDHPGLGYTSILLIASFPGSPGTRICIAQRAWYLSYVSMT